MENQYDGGLQQRSLEVSETLLHWRLDSSQQVSHARGTEFVVLVAPNFRYGDVRVSVYFCPLNVRDLSTLLGVQNTTAYWAYLRKSAQS